MRTTAPASGRLPSDVTTVPRRRPSPTRRWRVGSASVSVRNVVSTATTLRAKPRYSSRRTKPSFGTCTSIRSVLSAPRPALRNIVPPLGALHRKNQPFSPVVTTRRGRRRSMPPFRKVISSHSPITVTPAAALPSRASRATPPTTPPARPAVPVGEPQMAARSRVGEGVARSARTDRWRETDTSRGGRTTPSESSSGWKKPSA